MPQGPDTLNDEQARHASKLFYDHLHAAAWEGGRKPAAERVATVVDALKEQAGPRDRVLLETLTGSNPAELEAQAAVARIVLNQALASTTFASAAQEAIAGARQPNMGPALEYGAMIVALLLSTTKIDHGADGWHVHLGGGAADIVAALRVPELLDKLPAVIKALPAEILARFT